MKTIAMRQRVISTEGILPTALSWATAVNADVLKRGTPLAPWQAALALEVGVRCPAAVRVLSVPRVPAPSCPHLLETAERSGLDFSTSIGMALGYAVIIHQRALGDRRVLRHEFRHVAQFETSGSLPVFLKTYLDQLVMHGYHDAPLEVDARRFEKRPTIALIDSATKASAGENHHLG